MESRQALWQLAALMMVLTFSASTTVATIKSLAPRQVVSLDGIWQIEQGVLDKIPAAFSHEVVVPGLVDMAQPAFAEVGKKSPLRQAFWYRRSFIVDSPLPEVAILKINKARYGTQVYLNGQLVGRHLPCFTPALLDVRPYLKGDRQSNELVIGIGADRESVPAGQPSGWDFEKYLFIPGIYDSVELILTGGPTILNVQLVPDITANTVKVVAEVQAAATADVTLQAQVVQAADGGTVGMSSSAATALAAKTTKTIELIVPIANCRLWSPEDPFLYELKLSSGGDAIRTRFGMRSFRFDPELKRAVLNGKPYLMRGTNVCIYRFFEDAARGDKPWRAEWVRRLHEQFKTMHWNSIRYCIGFPPEIWYDIADETGFLIQDEFPIWTLGDDPEKLQAEKIIPEYIQWMRERWNHPCVVIWDGQNESNTAQSGKAIQAVRKLDLSNRPWDNGWAEPQSLTDCVESHPYFFIRNWQNQPPFRLKELANHSGVPHLNNAQKKLDLPVIINEYDWLWITRDGNPTCLTDKVYLDLLGPTSTVEQRRHLHARYVAALTEFWRGHRHAAGVLHFCGLGYSRPGDQPRPQGGATSDDFVDLEQLTFEPNFAKYVKQAFNPLGLMLDFWAEDVPAGSSQSVKLVVINDLYKDWKGPVKLSIIQGDKTISEQQQPGSVDNLGQQMLTFTQPMPAAAGNYTLIASVVDWRGATVQSLRDFKVLPAAATKPTTAPTVAVAAPAATSRPSASK